MYNITNNKSLSNFSCKCELQRQKGSMDRQNQGKPLWSRVSLGRAMMPWRHYTDFIGAHSPFSTVCKWAQRGLIKWVCGFLLKSRGPLHPTPVRKQIKLQFHHLEGAVSCPNATLAPPTLHIYTQNSTPLPQQSSPAPKMPASFHCSIAERNGGIWGKKEGKRGMGGCSGKRDWEYAWGSYSSFIPMKYFAMEKVGERVRQKGYTAVALTQTETYMHRWQ